jgi:hypothetical protein
MDAAGHYYNYGTQWPELVSLAPLFFFFFSTTAKLLSGVVAW